MEFIDISQTEEIFSISRLNREVRFILEGSFATLWVEGEISNFAAPNSGHWYFSLKDAQAQVRCAMFKPLNRKLALNPKDGMHVMAKARVSLYEGRGEFQLIIEHLEEIGEGKLQLAFEALKKRLLESGLFDPAHKKTLPSLPRCIGIITSPTGAAIRDILSVLKRRYPCVPIIIYPTLVQGDSAAPTIVQAIQIANQRKECDVLILARGGGSLEDLWPFNEEIVAQAIFKSQLPIISGIGHEVDFTIADFVADVRAPTPSAAAELATPDKQELLQSLALSYQQLLRQIQVKIQTTRQHLNWQTKQLQQQHPKRKLMEQQQLVDFHETTLIRLQKECLTKYQTQIHNFKTQLSSLTPMHAIRNYRASLNLQQHHLSNRLQQIIQKQQQTLSTLAGKLDSLSPLATLKRGYAIVTHHQHSVKSQQEVQAGDKVHVRLSDGSLHCTVDKTDKA